MADEYILRSIAIAKLTALEVTDPFATIADAKRVLADMAAADVAKVVHGKWYLLDDCANAGLYCSVCSRRVHREEFAYKKLRSKYCPHCGAKMDGGNGRETD